MSTETEVIYTLENFGTYTLKESKTFITHRGIDYSATVYKGDVRIGGIYLPSYDYVASFDFLQIEIEKDAKALGFENASHMLTELSYLYD
jgi:hypothetical protein